MSPASLLLPLLYGNFSLSYMNIPFQMNSPMMTVYSASKAALDRMTQVEALRLAPFGIRINNINPGPVLTNIGSRNNPHMDEGVKVSNDEMMVSYHFIKYASVLPNFRLKS